MIFENLVNKADAAKVPWEGSLPEVSWPPPCDGLFETGFVPVECKAGDLVVFSGKYLFSVPHDFFLIYCANRIESVFCCHYE
jgi:hypothetical protein